MPEFVNRTMMTMRVCLAIRGAKCLPKVKIVKPDESFEFRNNVDIIEIYQEK